MAWRMTRLLSLGILLIPFTCFGFFSDQFSDPKWTLVYLITTIGLFFLKRIEIPHLGRARVFLLVGICASYILSMVLNWPGSYENQILDWICFFALTLLAYNGVQSKDVNLQMDLILRANSVATVGVLIYGLLQWMNYEPFPVLMKGEFPASFFGFQNMTAEFIGISILLQGYSILFHCSESKSNSKIKCLSKLLLIVISCIYLWLLACRSVFVALFCSLGVCLFLMSHSGALVKRTRAALLCLFIAMGGMILSFSSFKNLPRPSWITPQILEIKSGNSSLRLARWKNTLKMISEHPFGIGPGNFEFSYIPYSRSQGVDGELSEMNLIRSPHNGYLQMAVQNGVFTILLYLILCGLILVPIFKNRKNIQAVFIASFLVFIAVDALFAFPLEVAYPFYATAIFLGWGLRLSEYKSISLQTRWAKYGTCTLLLLVGSLGLLFFSSKMTEGVYFGDYEMVSFSCKYFPSNWRVCARKANLELEKENPSLAEASSRFLLGRNSYNFVAMRNLGFSLLDQGKLEPGCKVLIEYDKLFHGESTLHETVSHQCSN